MSTKAKTVPDYPGGAGVVLMFAIMVASQAWWDGRGNPLLWGLLGGAITLFGVAVVWATCGRFED